VLDGYLLLSLAAVALQRLDLGGKGAKQLHREIPVAVLLPASPGGSSCLNPNTSMCWSWEADREAS
jgi:hypothetical protein